MRVSPQTFLRLARGLAGAALLVIHPLSYWIGNFGKPASAISGREDFSPYYAGGLVAARGLWKGLYPAPKPEIYNRAPDFSPGLRNRWFNPDPESRRGKWIYYPQVADATASTVAPELAAACPHVAADWRYVYPPPLAILMWPLGYLSYPAASNLWFWLTCASLFGLGIMAARISRAVWGQLSYAEGVAVLLPLAPVALRSEMGVSVIGGNANALIGFLIAASVYAWMRRRQVMIAFAMIPMLLFKGIGLSWCPLFLFRPVKWRLIGTLAALTLLFNGLAYYFGGAAVYRAYAEVLPKALIPLGVSLEAMFLVSLGWDAHRWVVLLNVVLLGLLYWGYWRGGGEKSPVTVAAAFAGIMAVFCLCNRVVWGFNYYTNFLLLPFAGWVLWEAWQMPPRRRAWFLGILALALFFWMDGLFLLRSSWLMARLEGSAYHVPVNTARGALNWANRYVLHTLEAALLLALAYRRLFFAPRQEGGGAV